MSEQPPEQERQAPPNQGDRPPSFLQRLRGAPATVVLCLASIVVFLLATRAGGTEDISVLVRFGATERSHIWRGEYWRFFTPMFLHIGWVHLLWNIYGIGGWCIPVERALGIPRFLAAYLLSGIFASAASVLGHDAVSAGASGAGFGIVGVTLSILLYNHGSFGKFLADPSVRSILFWVGIWVVLGFTAMRMDNYAHLGGFAFGALLGWIFTQSSKWDPAYRRMAWAMALTVLAFAVAAAAKRWPSQTSRWGAHEAMIAAEGAMRRGDPQGALSKLNEAYAYGDESPELFQARGFTKLLLGRPAEAASDFERALQKAPPDWAHRKAVTEDLAAARRVIPSAIPSVIPSASQAPASPSSSSSGK